MSKFHKEMSKTNFSKEFIPEPEIVLDASKAGSYLWMADTSRIIQSTGSAKYICEFIGKQ